MPGSPPRRTRDRRRGRRRGPGPARRCRSVGAAGPARRPLRGRSAGRERRLRVRTTATAGARGSRSRRGCSRLRSRGTGLPSGGRLLRTPGRRRDRDLLRPGSRRVRTAPARCDAAVAHDGLDERVPGRRTSGTGPPSGGTAAPHDWQTKRLWARATVRLGRRRAAPSDFDGVFASAAWMSRPCRPRPASTTIVVPGSYLPSSRCSASDVLDMVLDGPAQRPGAERRVPAELDELVLGRLGDLEASCAGP